MKRDIVLIACGKGKLPCKSKAKDLYQGDLFRKSWAAAEKEYPKADRFILSAKYSLLEPDIEIEPYDVTLIGKRAADKKAWAEKVIEQLKKKGYDLEKDSFIFYAGQAYTKYLVKPHGPISHFQLKYEGCNGIGSILKSLNSVLLTYIKNFHGSNLESVVGIRNNINTTPGFVKKEPGVYRLWVKEAAGLDILSRLNCSNLAGKLLKKNIQGTDYLAMYFGMSKNMYDRMKWHVLQNHDAKTVKNGVISTLRHTLSAILFSGKPLTTTRDELDTWMDENCFFEWEYTPGTSMAAYIEKDEISQNIYPLNIQDNDNISKELRDLIKQLRKEVKR